MRLEKMRHSVALRSTTSEKTPALLNPYKLNPTANVLKTVPITAKVRMELKRSLIALFLFIFHYLRLLRKSLS